MVAGVIAKLLFRDARGPISWIGPRANRQIDLASLHPSAAQPCDAKLAVVCRFDMAAHKNVQLTAAMQPVKAVTRRPAAGKHALHVSFEETNGIEEWTRDFSASASTAV